MSNIIFLNVCLFLIINSFFLINHVGNIMFIILLALLIFIILFILLIFIGYELTAVWLLIIYGGAITMFVVIGSSLIKNEIVNVVSFPKNLKKNKLLINIILILLLIVGSFNYLLLLDLDLFIKNFVPNTFTSILYDNFESKFGILDTVSLSFNLFITYDKVVIWIGILLFIIMVTIITILFPEHLK